ncbi:hypothetical protein DPMN_084403 [Dreissena polymorpha]|uniref:Uncharacterized protein n=1 Tax=Dreissena polymorpha TaxID=45954 RepID=A0A9D3YAZ0_DREPO|nr:hypothetical protein DPMN_084403 [Dreissena polymorpha]
MKSSILTLVTPLLEEIGKTKQGVGYSLLLKNCIVAQEATHLHTDCENVWVMVDIHGFKSLLIGSYYKPKEYDPHSLEEFKKSISIATKS